MIKKTLNNQEGQGIMEYVIIASLVGIFCLVAMSNFGKSIKKRIDYMKKEIVEHIRI